MKRTGKMHVGLCYRLSQQCIQPAFTELFGILSILSTDIFDVHALVRFSEYSGTRRMNMIWHHLRTCLSKDLCYICYV